MNAAARSILRHLGAWSALTMLAWALGSTQAPAADDATLDPGTSRRTVVDGVADADDHGVAFRELDGGVLNRFNSALPVAAEEGLWRESKGLPISARIRLHVSRVTIPADGYSFTALVIRLYDEQGAPITTPARVTVETTLGRLQVPSGKEAAAFEIAVPHGEAELTLIAPPVPGDALLRVSSGAIGVQAKLSFVPDLRPLVAIGIVEGGVAEQHVTLDPNAPAVARIGFEDSLQHWGTNRGGDGTFWSAEGRTAGFVKGTIAPNVLLTASYDSNKLNVQRFFADIDPNQYFPISGDASLIKYDARSTSKLYLRLDEGKSHVLYGDFQTTSPTEKSWLGSYARTLTGVTAHYETPDVRANAFAARESTHQFVDEQPGRGLSGPYAVSQSNAVANSETIELLVRDRNQPALVLSRQVLTRFVDYDFEPFSGRLIFRQPVPSVDENLNPVSIRITYEVASGGPEYWVDGANAEFRVTNWLSVGARAAENQDPLTPYKLYGANSVLQLDEHTRFTIDAARSVGSQLYSAGTGGQLTPVATVAGLTSFDPQGNAGRVELVHQDKVLDARMFAAKTDLAFENANAGIAPGRTEAGGHATYRVDERTQLIGDLIHSEDATTGAHRSAASATYSKKFWQHFKVDTGLSYVDQTYNAALPAVAQYATGAVPGAPGSTGSTLNNSGFGFLGTGLLGSPLTGPYALSTTGTSLVQQTYASGRVKVTDKLSDNASLYTEYEHTLDSHGGERAAAGGEYRFGDHGRLYGRYEMLDSVTGIYGLGDGSRVHQAVLGADTSYMRDGSVYSEYRLAGTESGQSAAEALGVRNLWRLGDGLNATTSVERQQVLSAPGSATVLGAGPTPGINLGNQTANAVAVALDYTASPLWKSAGRLEYRFSDVQTNWLSTLALSRKLSDDWSLIGRNVYLSSHSAGTAAANGRQDQDRAQIGVAYRDIDTNKLNMLARYEYRIDKNSTALDPTDSHSQIAALLANYQPVRDWTIEGQVAAKKVIETLGGVPANFRAELLSTRVTHDLNSRWDVGVLASTTNGGGTSDKGVAFEVGYRVIDNLWLSIGAVAGRYADTELFSSNSAWQGVYLRARFKFDEKSFSRSNPAVDRALDSAATTARTSNGDRAVPPAEQIAPLPAPSTAAELPRLPGKPLDSRVAEPAQYAELQRRIDVELQAAGERCMNAYDAYKAQAWLNFAKYAHHESLPDTVRDQALRDADGIVTALETHQAQSHATNELPGAQHLRDDMWRAAADGKQDGRACGAPKLAAFCEVQLAWAGYEASAGGWRHVDPYIRIAEDYCAQAQAAPAVHEPEASPASSMPVSVEPPAADSPAIGAASPDAMPTAKPDAMPPAVPTAMPDAMPPAVPSASSPAAGRSELPTMSASVLFPHNRAARADMRPAGRAKLRALVDQINRLGSVTQIVITGHADLTGKRKYNLALSERRARSLSEELVSLGVDPAKIVVHAVGSAQPTVRCKQSSGAKARCRYLHCLEPNRRVTVDLVIGEGAVPARKRR